MTAILCILACPFGEFMLRNCTDTQSGVCWPCDAGFMCNTTSRVRCTDGVTWSRTASTVCAPCSSSECPTGSVLVRECTVSSDRVCALCPDGFGCVNGTMAPCGRGTYSVNGVCEKSNGTVCDIGQIEVNGECRACPDGYGCTDERIVLCARNTYSAQGSCVPCTQHSQSPPGSSALNDCVCDPGYVRVNQECRACDAGTVWIENIGCTLCPAGEYCVGKTHHEPCPVDMYSHRGSALCMECKPFSTCTSRPSARCVDAVNCTCEDGYVGDTCSRCAPGTAKHLDECVPCEPGMQCLGGPLVEACPLATYSPGNLSQCIRCKACPELTRARCNATHDSVCEKTQSPLAVITVFQEYRTKVDGETFGMFAMVYATSLPRAQLLRVCNGQDVCVGCFQGACPPSLRTLGGPEYRMAIEIRSDASRLMQNLEALTHTAFLMETAKHAMAKVTTIPFVAYSRVEHNIICPEGGVWDGVVCAGETVASSSRTWVGLLVCVIVVALCAVCRRRESSWVPEET